MNILRIVMPAAMLLIASQGYANCSKPNPPEAPDGDTSTEAEMVEGQSAVKAYMEEANAYLECLDKEEADAGEEEAVEAKEARIAAYNQTVDDMEKLAAQFNEEVREWKAKSGE